MKGYRKVLNVWVNPKVFTTKFCCDYSKCNGACCWKPLDGVSLEGGELDEREHNEIVEKSEEITPYCEQPLESSLTYKKDGLFYSSLVKGKCVMCNMESKTCALKTAFSDGKISFPIPKSCQLYPLAVTEHKNGKHLIVDNLFDSFCKEAFEKGERENIYLIDFCKDAIIRTFGEIFYKLLKNQQQLLL